MIPVSDIQKLLCRIAGIFLLLLPFIPLEAFFGQLRGVEAPLSARQWLAGTSSVALISLLFLWIAPQRIQNRVFDLLRQLGASAQNTRAPLLLLSLTALVFAVSHFAFHHRPHLVDSVIQLFQGQLFAQGMLKAPPIEQPEFVMNQHLIFSEDGWYGQYPPLHSALLAVGVFFSFPWLSQWLCSIIAAWCIYRLSEVLFDKKTATTCLVILLFCPFYLFMSGSMMNHVPTMCFIAAFLLQYCLWEQRDKTRHIFFAGLCIACAFLIRPLTAVSFGVVFGVCALTTIRRTRNWSAIPVGLLGFLPIASLLPLYNYLTNGDPWLSGYIKLWGERHKLGFHESPWGEMHTPLTGLRNELIDISLLNEFLFESPVPALLPLALFLLVSRKLTAWDFRLIIAFFAVPFCYGFYWHRDAFLGPRFLFETLPCLVILLARSITLGISDLSEKKFGSEKLFGKVSLQRWAILSLLVSFLVMITLGIPQRFTIDATSLTSMKRSIVSEAKTAGIDQGIIFVKVSWGNRLLARLMGIGVSASLAQRAYSSVDHCILQELVDRESDSSPELEQHLESLTAQKMSLLTKPQVARLSKDLSLKLRPDFPPTARCLDELKYDQSNYSVYIAALLENSPSLDGPFVIVRDLRDLNAEFMRSYPGKQAYIFDGSTFRALTNN